MDWHNEISKSPNQNGHGHSKNHDQAMGRHHIVIHVVVQQRLTGQHQLHSNQVGQGHGQHTRVHPQHNIHQPNLFMVSGKQSPTRSICVHACDGIRPRHQSLSKFKHIIHRRSMRCSMWFSLHGNNWILTNSSTRASTPTHRSRRNVAERFPSENPSDTR